MRYTKFALLSSLCPAALFSASVAGAQTAPTPAAAAAPAAAPGDIVVTAQRRSENVLKVPVSVSVVSGAALAQRGINDLSAVTKLTPSLQVAQDNTFSVRGIGTATFAPTVESSVSQVVDEVVLGNIEFASNAFYDVEQIEVLNGPQGLLFGKNASAGLVNITTIKPKIGVLSDSGDIELTDRYRPVKDGHGIQLRDTLNLPVTQNSALRLNFIYSGQDSLTYPEVNPAVRNDLGVRNLGVRAKYLVEPTDALSIYVIGDYNRQRGISGRYDVTFRELGAGSIYAGTGQAAGPDNLIYAADAPNYRDTETGGAQVNVNYRLGSGIQLTNIAAWKHVTQSYQFDSDNTPTNYFDINDSRQIFNQYSEEFRVALPQGNRLSGQAGLYYYHSIDSNTGQRGGDNGLPGFLLPTFPFCVGAVDLGAPPGACPVSNNLFLGQDYRYKLKENSYAAFAQATYSLTDRLKFTAGGRVTHDKDSINLLENVENYFVPLGVPDNHSVQSTSNTNFSFKVGPQWQITPHLLAYGFYGQGYKGPGFSNTSPAPGANLAVKPEISRGGEIGLKGQFLDRRLTVSVAGFYTRFSDLQIQSFIQELRTFVLSNAATATTKGFDLSIQAQATPHLTLTGSASYADAKFNDYPGAQCYPTQITDGCHANVNSTDPAFVGVFNAAGFQVPLSARFTTTIGAEYHAPLTEQVDWQLGADFYHRSPESSATGAPFLIPTWNTLDAHAGISGRRWSISLFCKNCTNSIRPVTIGSDGGDANPTSGPPVLTLSQRFSYDSVRTVGLRLGFNL